MSKLTTEEVMALPRVRVGKTVKKKIEREAKKLGVAQYKISLKVAKAGIEALGL